MPRKKIFAENWLVEFAIDPKTETPPLASPDDIQSNRRVEDAVRAALERLTPREKEFAERYYFMGESYIQVAQALGLRLTRVEGLHRRVNLKLRKLLTPFVKVEYGLKINRKPGCIICRSRFRQKIDRLIRTRKKSATWKLIMMILRENHNIMIKTPQILIAHQKYHMEVHQNGK